MISCRQKIYYSLITCLLAIFLLAPYQLARAADKLPMGSFCTDNSACASGDCENSLIRDKNNSKIAFCDCHEDSDCQDQYGPPTDGGKWQCKDGAGAKLTYDLDYCISTGKQDVRSTDLITEVKRNIPPGAKIPTGGILDSLADAIFDIGAFRVGLKNEITTFKPTFNIRIPGLNLTDAANTIDAEGNLQLPWLAELITALYKLGIAVASIVAVVMLIIEGARVITSAGGEAKVAAYKRIGQICVGLFLVWGSYSILYIINPDLVNFRILKVRYIERQEMPEAKSDESGSEFNNVPAPGCKDPNAVINNLSTFDPNVFKGYGDLVTKLTPQKIALYKSAVAAVPDKNVPWEILATIHYKEASMKSGASILNGGKLCNTANDGDLLKWCGECNNPSELNDLICGVKKIRDKAGAGDLSPNNISLVKTVFCKYNGCFTCPDAHPYVVTFFDAAHANISKQTHDCVPAQCNLSATSDFTTNPPARNKGCTITIFSTDNHPNIGLSNYCTLNQIKQCGSALGNKTTYKYNNNKVSAENPCGSWTIQSRVGALGVYAYILKLEKEGKIR